MARIEWLCGFAHTINVIVFGEELGSAKKGLGGGGDTLLTKLS